MLVEITNGIIVRNVKSKGAFDGEDVDSHGRLERSSVDGKQGCTDYRVITRAMDHGFYPEFAYCNAKKVRQKGGKVYKDPVPGNRNHCILVGIYYFRRQQLIFTSY